MHLMSGKLILGWSRLQTRLSEIAKVAQVDVSDEGQVQSLVAKAVSWGGRLDIWVNNAAKFVFRAATTATDAGKSNTHYHTFLLS